ncbi:hypothetical protein ACLB2K_061361 [Fragaria x ananassa]
MHRTTRVGSVPVSLVKIYMFLQEQCIHASVSDLLRVGQHKEKCTIKRKVRESLCDFVQFSQSLVYNFVENVLRQACSSMSTLQPIMLNRVLSILIFSYPTKSYNSQLINSIQD